MVRKCRIEGENTLERPGIETELSHAGSTGMLPPFLISLIVSLVIVGLVLWVLSQLPIDPWISNIIRVVIIVCVVLWLLSVLVGYGGLSPYGLRH